MPRPAKERDRVFSIWALRQYRAKAWSMLAAVVRQRASQQPRISWDLTLSRFVRRDRIWSIRTCEVQILWVPGRSAQASCAFGISGSGVAGLRAVGLRLGNRSLHSTFESGGSAKLSVTGRRQRGTVMEPACSFGFRRHWSILLTFQYLMSSARWND